MMSETKWLLNWLGANLLLNSVNSMLLRKDSLIKQGMQNIIPIRKNWAKKEGNEWKITNVSMFQFEGTQKQVQNKS